ncbi:MAG: M48 family metallopeptidase [Candidatus Jordarchaeaceae archaeon]
MDNRARIRDLEIEYTVDYRDVKYPRLEFKTGDLLLILPKNYEDTKNITEKHKEWIYKKALIIKKALEEAKDKTLNLNRTEEELKSLVYSTVTRFKGEFNLDINKVYFRKMKSKWGSLSRKRNLTINTLLKYLPDKLIEYVIFHEMVHIRERKHNDNFWKMISKKFKDHQIMEQELLVYWFLIHKTSEGEATLRE